VWIENFKFLMNPLKPDTGYAPMTYEEAGRTEINTTSNDNASETKANESFDNGVFFDI
jgi:hypothetical protein